MLLCSGLRRIAEHHGLRYFFLAIEWKPFGDAYSAVGGFGVGAFGVGAFGVGAFALFFGFCGHKRSILSLSPFGFVAPKHQFTVLSPYLMQRNGSRTLQSSISVTLFINVSTQLNINKHLN